MIIFIEGVEMDIIGAIIEAVDDMVCGACFAGSLIIMTVLPELPDCRAPTLASIILMSIAFTRRR